MCCEYGESSTFFVVTEFPSRKYVVSQAIYCVASGTLIIPTVTLNGISVLTIWKSSHLKAKFCYFLILVQSIFDIAVGVISVPTNIAVAALELRGIASCLDIVVVEAIAFIPVGVSLSTICLLTFERYIHEYFAPNISSLTCNKGSDVGLRLLCGSLGYYWSCHQIALGKTSHRSEWCDNIIFFYLIHLCIQEYTLQLKRCASQMTAPAIIQQNRNHLVWKKKENHCEKDTSPSLVDLSYFSLCYLCYMPFTVCYLYFRNDQINFRVAYCWCGILISLNSSLNSLVFFWKRPSLSTKRFKKYIEKVGNGI